MSFRRAAHPLAAPLLDFWAPGSLYLYPSCHGDLLRGLTDLFTETPLRLRSGGLFRRRHWFFRICRLEPSYVHHRDGKSSQCGLLSPAHNDRRPHGIKIFNWMVPLGAVESNFPMPWFSFVHLSDVHAGGLQRDHAFSRTGGYVAARLRFCHRPLSLRPNRGQRSGSTKWHLTTGS